ncbi:lipase member H-like [Diprion similis]|uniref:lipase member H-like n=1 Tax=Diprion similis TaxID=362088 RepID=UPI001EF7AAAF|nr:lipase member H-like [Diprion similis]
MVRYVVLVSLCLPFATTQDLTDEHCDTCRIKRATRSQLADIKVRLYTGEDLDTYTEVVVGDATELLDKMNLSKPTVLFVHGWFGTIVRELYYNEVTLAYLEQKTHNVLYFNWETISTTDYLSAGMSVPGVGYTLAKVLNEMVAAGLNSSSLHLVGHSFGAQALGYVGRSVNFTVPRIVGLDPAGLLFYTYMPHLNSSDADYVEVIHTGMGSILSSSLQLGDVDFYPNGGEYANQGCTVLPAICGHARACLLYAEFIRNKTALIGRACDSYSNFKDGSCDSNGTVVMGYATPNTASGKYYLQTNSFSPYGRGEEGATYESIIESLLGNVASVLSII